MDRSDGQVPKLQDSFIAHLLAPLVHAMNDVGLLPVADASAAQEPEIVANLKLRHPVWKELLPKQPDAETVSSI